MTIINQLCSRFGSATVLVFAAVLAACAPKRVADHPYPLYGWIADHGEDPYGQGIVLVIPPNAPSIQSRYRPFPVTDEQGNFMGVHEGIDVSGNIGDPIMAAAAGTVTLSKYSRLWGHMVRIAHGRDQHDRNVQTLYIHLTDRRVESNDRVQRGQQIGTMGITGVTAGNPTHLHYVVYTGPTREFSRKWKPANPHLYWADGEGVVSCYDPSRSIPDQPLRFTYPVPCR
ncbi:MAG: M23 family metallopeptidase [Gammaproteobacteria bacterium]|nr:M23 family metallopeptidase [Gammaproteobacteria bacterium]